MEGPRRGESGTNGAPGWKAKYQVEMSSSKVMQHNTPWRLCGELQTRSNIKMGPSGYVNNQYENNVCVLFLGLCQNR